MQPQQSAQPQVQPDQQAQGQGNQPVPPETLTLPEGTVIRVRVDEWISSDRSSVGDSFSAVLEQPIVVNGWVVVRRGQAQTGRVSVIKKGTHGGTSQLGIELPELTLVDGQQMALQTQLSQTSGGSSTGRNVAAVGSTTGLGAVIGAIVGGGTGAAVGAGVGGHSGSHRRDVVAGKAGRDSPGNSSILPPAGAGNHLNGQQPVCVSTGDAIGSGFTAAPQPPSHGQARAARAALLSVCISLSIRCVSYAVLRLWILRRIRRQGCGIPAAAKCGMWLYIQSICKNHILLGLCAARLQEGST